MSRWDAPGRARAPPAHRIAYKIATGEDPPDELDHANRDKLDNRLVNLRPATREQNNANGAGKRRTVGHGLPRGVHRHKQTGKYLAKIRHNRRLIYLGTFDTPQAAGLVAALARELLHEDFAFGRLPDVGEFTATDTAEALDWINAQTADRLPELFLSALP